MPDPTTALPPAAAVPPAPITRRTNASRFQLAEQVVQNWAVMVEEGTTVDDLLKPEFFTHVAPALRPFSKIFVLTDDGSYYAELLVRNAGRTWANCVLLSHIDLSQIIDAVPPTAAASYKVAYAGPHHRYRVVRLSDNTVISKEHFDEAAAQAWLVDHIKAIAR